MKLVRSPNIVLYWEGGRIVLEEFVRKERTGATPLVALVLDAFSTPRTSRGAAVLLRALGRESVLDMVQQLRERGFLVPESSRDSRTDVSAAWAGSIAAAYYHFATRDVPCSTNPFEWLSVAGEHLAASHCPSVFKDYRCAPFRPLPKRQPQALAGSLWTALRERRTVRTFAATPVRWSSLAVVLRGTWGKTGSLDEGILGKLLTKTSPSAGARHPIECYVLAWNVSGLAPGLYHYSVRRDGLECLHAGDLRRQAVGAASGQEWVAGAAFVCVLTAVVDRVFWKYPCSDSYRLFLLDAGHIAQTFCLLATAAGLGPFTTAAIQQSRIERLLRIDGVAEFPVYLCGAGVPNHSAGNRVPGALL